MNQILRGLGLLLILAGVVLLLVGEKFGDPLPIPPVTLLSLGMVSFLAGVVLAAVGKASRVVSRRRCVRCSHQVDPGEVYCTLHFREAIDRIRDSQRAG
jgi:drug/metabolite transporter (DMT)-like permease